MFVMRTPTLDDYPEMNILWRSDNGKWGIILDKIGGRYDPDDSYQYLGRVNIIGPDFNGSASLRGDGSVDYNFMFCDRKLPKYVQAQVESFFAYHFDRMKSDYERLKHLYEISHPPKEEPTAPPTRRSRFVSKLRRR